VRISSFHSLHPMYVYLANSQSGCRSRKSRDFGHSIIVCRWGVDPQSPIVVSHGSKPMPEPLRRAAAERKADRAS